MRRVVAVAVLVAATATACVQDRSFRQEGDVCYRRQVDKWFFVIPVNSNEVQSLPENCRDR